MLARLDQAVGFGYDPLVVAPMLQRAETRVRGYLASRASASTVLNAVDTIVDGVTVPATVPPALTEVVLSVADRLAKTHPLVAQGAVSEQSGQEQLGFGALAYAGVSDLNPTEKMRLDALYPRQVRSVDILQ